MSRLRTIAVIALFGMTITACGGEGEQTPDQTSSPGPDQTSSSSPSQTTTPPGGGTQSSQGGAPPAGSNSISYRISGGFEASGEAAMTPTMSFFSEGVWTVTFAAESGALLILGLDPSTPSINFTEGPATIGGDSSTCQFDIDHQDASGASGSFTCSDVAMVNGGVLSQAEEFSGTFDFSS